MSRILLVDDSPHAQRIGERILSDEGFEVVTVSNADSAMIRLEDVDPDVVLADAVMPGRTGYEICQYLKMSPRHRHVRVILTAGILEAFDEEQMKRVGADASLKKPFEATALLAAVKPLAEAATNARPATGAKPEHGPGAGARGPTGAQPFVAVIDAEQVRAAVAVALDASMGAMVEEIAGRVLAALTAGKPDADGASVRAGHPEPADAQYEDAQGRPRGRPLVGEPPKPAEPPPAAPYTETVRRVTPLRLRSGSILGLNIPPAAPETPREPGPLPSEPLKSPRE
jgi:CheY-like chemotaxis protein